MPRYDYHCPSCDKTEERFERMGDTLVECTCGNGLMVRQFSPPMAIHCDLEPYFDENLGAGGAWVKSKQHKRQLLKQEGLEQKR